MDTIFSALNQLQLNQLINSAELIQLDKNAILIQEGSLEKCFYYLLEGKIEIVKHSGAKSHTLTYLMAGEIIGEMALLDNAPRSASAICVTFCKVYKFDINKLNDDPKLAPILTQISEKINQKITNRLRYTDQVIVEALKSKYMTSIFSVRILIFLSLYALSLSVIEKSKQYFPSTAILSLALIIIFTFVILSIIKKSGNPLSFYGFTLKNAAKNLVEGIAFSIPVMLFALVIKWFLIDKVSS